MRKKLPITFAILFFCYQSFSQDLLGLGTSNYSGVVGMTLNPASIVDNRLKFDLNIIGVSNYYSNNYLSVKRDALINGSFFKSKYKDWSLVQRDLLQENNLPANENVNARLNNRVMAPLSFMATTGEKSAIALTINNRTNLVLNNLNQNFARLFYNNFDDHSLYYTPINMSGVSTDILNWLDVGFTYGRVLLDNNEHFLKAAFTAKYIGGVASGYLETNNAWIGFLDKENFVATSGYTSYGHSNKLSTDMFRAASLRSLRPESEGFGWSAGLVYEYRGNVKHFKYLTPEGKEKNRRDVNKYALRLGVSIMDAGKLIFDKGGYNNDFTANINNWNLSNYNIKKIQDVDNMLAEHVNYVTTDAGRYSVALPTALSVQMDLHVAKGFYINAMTYQPVKMVEADRYMKIESMYAITPRFESKGFGLYLPVTYTEFDNWNLGATLRLGPLYIGSNNLASLVFNDKVRTADIHAGVRIPIAHGSPGKISKFYDRLVSGQKDTSRPASYNTVNNHHSDSVEQARLAQIQALQARLYEMEKQRIIDSMRLVLQQTQPTIVAPAAPPVNIFINNYPANGKPLPIDSLINIAQPVKVDNKKKLVVDSTNKKQSPKTNNIVVQKDTVFVTDTIYKKSEADTSTSLKTNTATEEVKTEVVRQKELTNTQINLLNARLQNNEKQTEEQRRVMQQDIERQRKLIREMETEISRLRQNSLQSNASASRTSTSSTYSKSADGNSYSNTITQKQEEKKDKKFRPFAFLSRKNKQQTVTVKSTTDSIVSSPTGTQTYEQTRVTEEVKEKKKFRPFAFLKKKNNQSVDSSVVTEQTVIVKEKKKFRPFAFLKKKDKAEQSAGAEEESPKKKKWNPFGFLKKKEKEDKE